MSLSKGSKKTKNQPNRTPAKRADSNQPTAIPSPDSDTRFVNLTVRIPYRPKNGTVESDVLRRIEIADDYAQLLEHPDCPDAFLKANA